MDTPEGNNLGGRGNSATNAVTAFSAPAEAKQTDAVMVLKPTWGEASMDVVTVGFKAHHQPLAQWTK